jgi:hypothetical protein
MSAKPDHRQFAAQLMDMVARIDRPIDPTERPRV